MTQDKFGLNKHNCQLLLEEIEKQTKTKGLRTNKNPILDDHTKELIEEFQRQEFCKEVSNRINYKLFINFTRGIYSL